MKNLMVLFAILCLSVVAFSQSADGDAAERRQIERLEAEWNTINETSDPEGKRRLLDDDSYHVGPSGRRYNKAQDIQAAIDSQKARPPGTKIRYEISDMVIRIYEGIAVVTLTGQKFTTEGTTTKKGASFRAVHVWKKKKDTWKIVVDQVTSIQ